MQSEDKVTFFKNHFFNFFRHIFLPFFFTEGGPLGKAMDTDPKHNNEAIQVGPSVPRLRQSDQNQEQDKRASKTEETVH